MRMASALRVQKQTLRKAMSATLKALSSASLEEQSRAVTAQVLALPAFQQAQSVSCYLSMPSGELDTASVVSEILGGGEGTDNMLRKTLMDLGKTLFVPKMDPSNTGHMDFLKVYGKEDLLTFPDGLWGIKEPGSQWQGSPRDSVLGARIEGLDIILVPGVAFDRSFSRLGHGKGYYDRFITSYTSTDRPKPLLVALALREQVLEKGEIPTGPHDWSMDIIVTPDEILSKE